jgi:hypothetical protein
MRFFTGEEHRFSKVKFTNEPIAPDFARVTIGRNVDYTVTVVRDGVVYLFGGDKGLTDNEPEGIKWEEAASDVKHNSYPIALKKAVVRAGQKFRVRGYETNVMASILDSATEEEAP